MDLSLLFLQTAFQAHTMHLTAPVATPLSILQTELAMLALQTATIAQHLALL
jgi:hypothetical protein